MVILLPDHNARGGFCSTHHDLIYLVDFTEENGTTVIWPSSHQPLEVLKTSVSVLSAYEDERLQAGQPHKV